MSEIFMPCQKNEHASCHGAIKRFQSTITCECPCHNAVASLCVESHHINGTGFNEHHDVSKIRVFVDEREHQLIIDAFDNSPYQRKEQSIITIRVTNAPHHGEYSYTFTELVEILAKHQKD